VRVKLTKRKKSSCTKLEALSGSQGSETAVHSSTVRTSGIGRPIGRCLHPLWVVPCQAVAGSQGLYTGYLLTFERERQLYAREAPYDVDLRRRAAGHELPVATDRYPDG
jgi:hypothetical protein